MRPSARPATVDPMTTLTARNPEDLLAVVPVVLGFEPDDSIVMLTVAARESFHARVDLPPDRRDVGEVVDVLLEPAVRHRVRSVVLLLYTSDEAMARTVVRAVRRADRGPVVVEALRVAAGRWFPLLRDRRGLGSVGVPYDVSSHPFVVDAVVSGRVLHGSRADLAATLRSDPAGVRAVAAAREPAGAAAATPVPPTAAAVAEVAETWAGRDDEPPADVAAGLLAAVAVPTARDGALLGVSRAAAGDHVRLWSSLVRRAPDDLVGHAAAVLAFCAWLSGDGALAWCAVDRARDAEPDHTLAVLVAELLAGAVPPNRWEVVRDQPATAS